MISIVLNAVIIRFYRSDSSKARPYILAMAILDCCAVMFGLVPRLPLALVAETSASVALYSLCYFLSGLTFSLYFYPTFFLALDRFLVVFLPHKFQLLFRKLRIFKVTLFSINLVVSSLKTFLELILGFGTNIDRVLSALTTFLFVGVIMASTVLYLAIACRVLRARKQMKRKIRRSRLGYNQKSNYPNNKQNCTIVHVIVCLSFVGGALQ